MICALIFFACGVLLQVSSFAPLRTNAYLRQTSNQLTMQANGLKIDMRDKTVFVAGVADSSGYGWAIAKACAEAGATILLGTWPPVLPIFLMGLERGQFDENKMLSDGSKMHISKVLTYQSYRSFSLYHLTSIESPNFIILFIQLTV